MRPGYVAALAGVFLTVILAALVAGVDVGAIAVIANGALIYGLTAALR